MQNNEIVLKLKQDLSLNLTIKTKNYKKDQIITNYINNRTHIFIMITGEADLIHNTFNGDLNIIDHFKTNDIFGDLFHIFRSNNELSVVAKRKCQVMMFDYKEIEKLKDEDSSYKEIMSILFILMSNKIADLNNRAAILAKRSIREKLLAYLHLISQTEYSKSFQLSLSLTELANYLSIDRSAMMRELNHLNQDGFIKRDSKKITLLY